MEKFHVAVLIEGYSYVDDGGQHRATGTSTLITGPVNVLVDTGSPWHREKLLEKLASMDIKPEGIDYVVSTHGHSDHVGNMNLFLNAKHIVGFDINYEDLYFDHDFKGGEAYNIYKNQIVVIPTPGHTHTDVSVIVKGVTSLGTVAICGDLFESENDDKEWKMLSESPEEQLENRQRIQQMVDYIIPGHGPIFKAKRDC